MERKTFLRLIYGLAVKGYRYDPKAVRSDSVVSEIFKDLQSLGLRVSDDTLRRKLKEAAALIDEESSNPTDS